MNLASHRWFLAAVLGASVAVCSPAFALQRPASEVQNLKQQAHSALASGQWDAAIQDYEKAIDLAPKEVRSSGGIGRAVLTKTGRLPDSIAVFQETLRLAPHNLASELGLAQAYRAVHNYEEAACVLRLAMREHPKSAEPLAAMGDFEIQQQTYDAAIGHLKASLALAPANVETRNLLAAAYLAKSDLASALAELQKVLARDSTNAHAKRVCYFLVAPHVTADDGDAKCFNLGRLQKNEDRLLVRCRGAARPGIFPEAASIFERSFSQCLPVDSSSNFLRIPNAIIRACFCTFLCRPFHLDVPREFSVSSLDSLCLS